MLKTHPMTDTGHSPAPVETDGEASNPGPRLRRRGPRSREAVLRRRARFLWGENMQDAEIAQDELIITHIHICGWLSNEAQFEAQMRLRPSLPQIVLMNETKLDRSVERPHMDGWL